MYDVVEFTRPHFDDALATKSFAVESVQTDKHASYLFGYLDHEDLGAQTIVVEREYVDGDFLDDFASYYATCFEPVDRFCRRVHFFSTRIDRVGFDAVIAGEAPVDEVDSLRRSYLGFIVVRPLPDAIIGRTQIKTYGSDSGRRRYRAVCEYAVSLFGLDLSVRSLAFQEQDQALAACATVALWSCFQKTARLFGTAAPRPPRITRDATISQHHRRSFPSEGLTLDQMCSAIRQNGLDPEVVAEAGLARLPLASLLYAYLEAELPVLLLVDIEGESGHAITVTGYSRRTFRVHDAELVRESGCEPAPQLPGLYIDEFYAHDDQHGPFSRLRVVAPTEPNMPIAFHGAWTHPDGKPKRLFPRAIVAPVYAKIRLTYAHALQWLQRVRPVMELVAGDLDVHVEWNLFLTTTNTYKHEMRSSAGLSSARRLNLLSASQPRFFWRCVLQREGGEPILELLIDATGFSKSFPIHTLNFFDEAFAKALAETIARLPPHPLVPRQLRTLIQTEFDDRSGPAAKAHGATSSQDRP